MAAAKPEGRMKRAGLLSYYQEEIPSNDSQDLNAPNFHANDYLTNLLKEKSLQELINEENEMSRHIRSLDSDMQTLVYENYNKFISATDTIRKMKNDFRKMEEEMECLSSNMESINLLSCSIQDSLNDKRQHLTQLTSVHALLRKLQFIFELPACLMKCIETKSYDQAVRYYCKVEKVLERYKHMPSFAGIQADCDEMVKKLRHILKERFLRSENREQLAETVMLLLKLKEPAPRLYQSYLDQSLQKFEPGLNKLEHQIVLISSNTQELPMDVLQFVDLACQEFLSELSLFIVSYLEIFIESESQKETINDCKQKLNTFVNSLLDRFYSLVKQRILLEKDTGDNTILVRALDRFNGRSQALKQLMPDLTLMSDNDMVMLTASDRVDYYLQALKVSFLDQITDLREKLATQMSASNLDFAQLLSAFQANLIEQVKAVLANLQAFVSPNTSFANDVNFVRHFCIARVREGLVVVFLRHILQSSTFFTNGPSMLILLLSKLALNLQQSVVAYLLTLVDEQLLITSSTDLTPCEVLCAEAGQAASLLMQQFVRLQGLSISQMLRKSVETRDWLNSMEPRSMRAVMKRVVEDVSKVDRSVGQLYPEGSKPERNSDSTQRSRSHSQWSYTTSSADKSLLSNIQKLFAEKIEMFSRVKFNKYSILSEIIKIGLKTFLESVRLRTFGKYGLQQIQVDTHYLHLYLWRFVQDEHLVNALLNEIVSSTMHRCVEPVTMEIGIVELICDRG